MPSPFGSQERGKAEENLQAGDGPGVDSVDGGWLPLRGLGGPVACELPSSTGAAPWIGGERWFDWFAGVCFDMGDYRLRLGVGLV
jgi:hypothetical protein